MMDTNAASDVAGAPGRDDPALPDEGEVGRFLASLRDEYRRELPREVVSGHLRMILAASAQVPAEPSLRDRWATRMRRVAAIGAVKIALTATAAAAATGTGMAATGTLPSPAQAAVAEAAERIGITLPSPAHDTARERTGADVEPLPDVAPDGVPAVSDDERDRDLPGRSSDAPGHQRDEDGRPATSRGAERSGRADERSGRADERSGRADEAGRPEAPGRSDTADRPDRAGTSGDTSGGAERPAPGSARAGGAAGDGNGSGSPSKGAPGRG